MIRAIPARIIWVTAFSPHCSNFINSNYIFNINSWVIQCINQTLPSTSHSSTKPVPPVVLHWQGRRFNATQITAQQREVGRIFFFPTPPNKWMLEANTEWIDFQLILDNLSILKILPTDKSNKQLSTLRKQFLFTFDISGQRYNTIKCTKH